MEKIPKYVCFTSMDKNFYNRCGKEMLLSFYQHWYPDFELYLYNEDFKPEESFCNLMGWNLGKNYENFQKRHTNNRVKTFAKKGFSIIHAMENINCEKLIWLDADTIIKTKIKKSKLDSLFPDNKISLHFGVNHFKNEKKYFSCETGFFILNKKHKNFYKFFNTYKNIYLYDLHKDLRRFYDGEVYGKTVQCLDHNEYIDLNINKKYKTPISKSELRHYIAHMKAGLKDKKNEV